MAHCREQADELLNLMFGKPRDQQRSLLERALLQAEQRGGLAALHPHAIVTPRRGPVVGETSPGMQLMEDNGFAPADEMRKANGWFV